MLKAANILMHVFHVAFMLFFLVAWAIPSLRLAHVIVSASILLSWFGIGLAIRQPGFCLATEIQYRIRSRLGIQSQRQSYIVYLVAKLTGTVVSPVMTETITQGVFYLLGLAGVVLWLRQ